MEFQLITGDPGDCWAATPVGTWWPQQGPSQREGEGRGQCALKSLEGGAS